MKYTILTLGCKVNSYESAFFKEQLDDRGYIETSLDEKPDIIMACGPLPMLKAIKEYAEAEEIPCQISLEERMGCGLGACLGCAVKKSNSTIENPEYWHVCKAGPVFNAKNVEI